MAIINNMIECGWLNLPYDSYTIRCKNLTLKYRLLKQMHNETNYQLKKATKTFVKTFPI